MKLNWFIIGIVLLAGCARFESRPISPKDTAVAWDARSLGDADFKKFLEKNLHRQLTEWPLRSWDFDELTLAALYYNPNLDVARAQWQDALGGEVTAGQRPNPTITASPGYDFTATSVGMNPWIPGVSFDIPVETMGKRGYRQAQARALSESARLKIAATAWQVRSDLRAAVVDYVAARRRESLLQREDALQEKVIQALQERLKAGEAASSEITLSQVARNKIELDFADARRQTVDARYRMAEAIGVPVRELAPLESDLDFPLNGSHLPPGEILSGTARDVALRSRTDILGALADYAASQSALQLEIAKQYPDIHFGPYYQYNNGDHQFTLSVSVELPLLNQNQGPIAEAAAHRQEMAARFVALQAKVINEIDHAAAAYRVATENLAVLQSLANSQRKENDSVKAQADAGAADNLDVLNSQLELAAGRLLQLDGQVKMEQAFDALEDAVQRPLSEISAETLKSPRPLAETKIKQP